MKVQICLIIFLFCFSLFSVSAFAVGYEFLDNGKVLHFWNNVDDYYLNRTSGMQWSNHYDEYWTHNVFCIGYYSGDTWNKAWCNDELIDFNEIIDADNSSINITYWRNFQYLGYKLQGAINYYLEENDTELKVTPYLKNKDVDDITVTLGFVWRVNKIRISNHTENNHIFINDTIYNLSQDLDLTFKNMSKEVYNGNCSLNITNETICNPYNETVFIPFYTITDNDKYMTDRDLVNIEWNDKLKYLVKIKSMPSQYNAPVDLGIKIGKLNSGQSKQTILLWQDPDAESPKWFDNSSNTTVAGDPILFSVNWTDNEGLGYYIFSTNNTGTWVNDSAQILGLNPDRDNVTLVAYFPMDFYNSSGIFDNSTYDFFGSFIGAEMGVDNITSGKIGQGLAFDGSNNDYVNISYDATKPIFQIDGAESISVFAWVKPYSANDEWEGIVSRVWNQAWSLASTGENYQFVFVIDSQNSVQAPINTLTFNTWSFIGGTYNGTDIIVYHNAVEVASGTIGAQTMSGTYDLFIGANPQQVKTWHGVIDEVYVYNYPLSQTEINELYILHNQSWSNVTKTLNSTEGAFVEWLFYANDTSNNWNTTDTWFIGTTTTTTTIPTIAEFDYCRLLWAESCVDIENLDYCRVLWVETNANKISNDNWCANNNTLARNVTLQLTVDGNLSTIISYREEVCQYGCDNVTKMCKTAPFTTSLWIVGFIFLALIAIGVAVKVLR